MGNPQTSLAETQKTSPDRTGRPFHYTDDNLPLYSMTWVILILTKAVGPTYDSRIPIPTRNYDAPLREPGLTTPPPPPRWTAHARAPASAPPRASVLGASRACACALLPGRCGPCTWAKPEADSFFFLLAPYPPPLPLWDGLAGLFLLFLAMVGVEGAATIGI